MNVICCFMRRACLVSALATLVGQAALTHAQSVLIDFGSDTSYRGLSVNNPDSNGNYWNSVQPGLLAPLIGVDNAATTLQLGWDTPVGTDSYNGPAGPTDETTLEENVLNTFIDPVALGDLGGALEAAFDFAAGYDGIDHFPVRFQIQGLNPAATYDLTFFGSHSFSNDPTTVYTIYTDDTYTTSVATASLDIQDPVAFFEPNRDRVAAINGVSPQVDNILYIEFVGATGFGGYLNDMKIVASAPALAGDFDGDGDVDGADLDVWKGEFGDVAAGLMADGDNDGDADGADFLIWQRELGLPGPAQPTAAAVPEPAGLAVLLIGSIALRAAKSRHKDN